MKPRILPFVALGAILMTPMIRAAESPAVAESPLLGYRVVALIDDGFHPEETPQPIEHWESLGAEVVIAGTRTGTARAAFGPLRLEMVKTVDEISLDEIDAIFVPGGTSPAKLRESEAVLDLVRRAAEAGKLIAAICHGPQVLIRAGVLEGRNATCVTVAARDYYDVRDELIAAGATFLDEPVVVDGNIVTSRIPDDVPYFKKAVAHKLTTRERR